MKDRVRLVLLSALLSVVITVPSQAQTVTGTISGTVTDSKGAVIPGAGVTLTSQHTGDVRQETTNGVGRFVFSSVLPDTYNVKIEKSGFEVLEQVNVVLSADEDLVLPKLSMTVGQANETVEVNESSARIDTESSNLSARLTSDQISQLQTKGRDITSLLRLMPGTSYVDDTESVGEGFGTDLPNFNGQRGRSTVTTIDGLNASEPSGSNKVSMTLNQDAIGEVKVLRNNYAAEYGNNGGGMIQIVSKSGGQTYHGSAYYFLRNEVLNANSWLNNHNTIAATGQGIPRPEYRHNIWGVTLGGPVKIPWLFPNPDRKKLFFFNSYERPHTITPQDAVFVTVPTAAERLGDFSHSINNGKAPNNVVYVANPALVTSKNLCQTTGTDPTINYQGACFRDPSRATPGNPTGLNIIPASFFDPNGQTLLNFFPLPNTVGPNNTNYVSQKSVNVPKWSELLHIDFALSETNTFSWKGQMWTADNEGFKTSGWPGGAGNTWGIDSHYLYKDNGTSLTWIHLFSSNVVNEITAGLRHDSEGFIPGAGEPQRVSRAKTGYNAAQLFPENNVMGSIPRVTSWSGVAGTGANINWLDRWGQKGQDYIRPSVADNLSFNRGNHQYKFGIYYEDLVNTEASGGSWSGTLNFSSSTSGGYTPALGNIGFPYANALLGNFNSYTESEFRPHTNLEIKLVQGYAQDSWKITRNFTLNYGLRLGYHTQSYQRDKLASNFDPTQYVAGFAPQYWQPKCAVNTVCNGSSNSKNQRAYDPIHNIYSNNTKLIGTFIKGSGNPTDGMVLQSDPLTPAGFKIVQPVDLEPRVGFAWSLFGDGKTVLRAMVGVYHAPRSGGGTTGGDLVSNPPFQRSVTINFNNGTASLANLGNLANECQTDAANCPALQSPGTVNAVGVYADTPTTYNFSLGIQRDLGFKTVLEATYVGSQSRHLGQSRNINAVPDGARFLTQNQSPFGGPLADTFLRPYQGYGSINMRTYTTNSNYNGLQVQLNRWYAHNFQYGAAYSWSKTMDYANDDTSDVNANRPYRLFNYGPADFDQTQILTVYYMWDLPKIDRLLDKGFARAIFNNWRVTGITSLVSGQPVSIDTAPSYSCPSNTNCNTPGAPITDFTGGSINARAFLICDPNKVPDGLVSPKGLPILINPNCFAKPTNLGDVGNTTRNGLRLPGIIATDLSLAKTIRIKERGEIQFRWEAYNLLNHANFKSIDTSLTFDAASGAQTNTALGTPTAVRFPRVMQGSLRVSF